jgi:hypothetical protein
MAVEDATAEATDTCTGPATAHDAEVIKEKNYQYDIIEIITEH